MASIDIEAITNEALRRTWVGSFWEFLVYDLNMEEVWNPSETGQLEGFMEVRIHCGLSPLAGAPC